MNNIKTFDEYNKPELLMEMATLRKNVTGLPVNIWVDDSGVWKESGHANRIKFQGDTGDRPNTRSMYEMTIDDCKIIGDMSKSKLKRKELDIIEQFIIDNRELLDQLGNLEIDIFDFKEKMKKYQK